MSDLDTLMNRDPLDLTNEDIDGIIAFLRAQRQNYAQSAEKKTARKSEKPIVNLSLDDLGL